MMTRRAIALSLCGVLMLMIGGGMATVAVWAAEMKAAPPAAPPIGAAKPVAKSAPPVAPQPSSPAAYHPVGKSDPFHPFIETDLALQKKLESDLKKKVATKARPISPLQQSEIGHFRLVGIAGDDKRRTAVVEDGTVKKFYPLFVGTVIGPNEGRVVEILPDRVIVEERIEDANPKAKKAQVRRMTMMLRKEEEGRP
jgi:Tfp pilus assembly protein PilP